MLAHLLQNENGSARRVVSSRRVIISLIFAILLHFPQKKNSAPERENSETLCKVFSFL